MEHFNKVKEYLTDLNFNILQEDTAEELVVVEKTDTGISNLIVDCEDPILIFEHPIFKLDEAKADVLQELLAKNRDIIHGAFAITDDNMLIFRDTLQLENLDKNEFEGTLSSLELLLAEYGTRLIELSKN